MAISSSREGSCLDSIPSPTEGLRAPGTTASPLRFLVIVRQFMESAEGKEKGKVRGELRMDFTNTSTVGHNVCSATC